MKQLSLLGSVFLVIGTVIGAGMLALPISIGIDGFFPAALILLAAFLFIVYMILLFVEFNLWFSPGSDLFTMSETLLGREARNLLFVCYLFLLYALLTAYISGMGALVSQFISLGLNFKIAQAYLGVIVAFLLGSCLYAGIHAIDRVNRLLTITLLLVLLVLIFVMAPSIEPALLMDSEPRYIWIGIPVALTAFLLQMVIPSIREYMDDQVNKIIFVLITGSVVALIIYTLWTLVISGIVPIHGEFGLLQIAQKKGSVDDLIISVMQHARFAWFGLIVAIFSMLAITTSFLGIALSLIHFIKDSIGFRESTNKNQALVVCLALIPPLGIFLINPSIFVSAVKYAGIIVTLVFCILPILMVWKGRYIEGRPVGKFRTFGGKPALIIAFLISIFIMTTDVAKHLNWLPSP